MSHLYRTLLGLIVELEQREASVQHQTVHDPLTGLANRALLEDRVDGAIARLRRNKVKFALLMLDLETVRLWWNRSGPMFAADVQCRRLIRMKGFWQWKWHLGEV